MKSERKERFSIKTSLPTGIHFGLRKVTGEKIGGRIFHSGTA
jgi:hypothetical protein